ncbi:unnamed protein product [Protopolystoma xenopodis]|uniref:Uncharacterized protein n=1 Tax=Protopolystoma xenopodis TaxID=117903 RepID=A0A448WHN0_9PLAT|nr:unnamed protein product [Protopolystoma xenopodis]
MHAFLTEWFYYLSPFTRSLTAASVCQSLFCGQVKLNFLRIRYSKNHANSTPRTTSPSGSDVQPPRDTPVVKPLDTSPFPFVSALFAIRTPPDDHHSVAMASRMKGLEQEA